MIVKTKRKFELLILERAFVKIQKIIDIADKEIGFLGISQRIGDTFVIHDVYITEQEVSDTTCILDPEGLEKLIDPLLEQGIDLNNLRFWGHSHVNMTCGPSAQDTRQIEDLLQDVPDYFIMGIFNKKNENYVEIHLKEEDLIICNVPIKIEEDSLTLSIKKEIEEKVKRKNYSRGSWYNHQYIPHNVEYDSIFDTRNISIEIDDEDLEIEDVDSYIEMDDEDLEIENFYKKRVKK